MIAEILQGEGCNILSKSCKRLLPLQRRNFIRNHWFRMLQASFTVTGTAVEDYLTVNVMITIKNMEEMGALVIHGGEQTQIVDIHMDASRTMEEFTTTLTLATPEHVKEIIIVFQKTFSHTRDDYSVTYSGQPLLTLSEDDCVQYGIQMGRWGRIDSWSHKRMFCLPQCIQYYNRNPTGRLCGGFDGNRACIERTNPYQYEISYSGEPDSNISRGDCHGIMLRKHSMN